MTDDHPLPAFPVDPHPSRRHRAAVGLPLVLVSTTMLPWCYVSPRGYDYHPMSQPIYATSATGAGSPPSYVAPTPGGSWATGGGSSVAPSSGYAAPSSGYTAPSNLLSPPYFGRIFVGRIPFPENDLTISTLAPSRNYVEVWVDGQEVPIILNSQRVVRPVTRGSHAGRTVSVYPPDAPSYGRLQFDSPGAHGFEVWCYTDVPGLGLVEVGHRSYSRGPGGFFHRIACQ